MSVYRDRERDYETRSAVGRTTVLRETDRERDGYSVKKIYRIPNRDVVPEDDRVSVYRGGSVVGGDIDRSRDRDLHETRVIRRERIIQPEPEPERREIRIVREERTESPPPPPPAANVAPMRREIRYERDYDRMGPYREYDRTGDLQRYTREVEYYPRPDLPPPIIIRQEPQQIIIQESAPRAPIVVPERDEADYQLVRRTDAMIERRDDTQSIARSSTSKRGAGKRDNNDDNNNGGGDEEEEEYYYERRTREVSRGDERGHRHRRHRDRDVSPGDSISQAGVARRRNDRRRYSSDESYDYVERRETRDADFLSDEEDPHHRLHLAEGAIAGIGAAELLRHNRKKNGDPGSVGARVGRDVGAAALGAIAVEGVSRARSAYREYSRGRNQSPSLSRSRSRSRHGRGRHHHHRHRHDDSSSSRSRSRSKSRVRKYAELGLGAAAVAAAAAYATRQSTKSQQGEDRESRPRIRDGSVSPHGDARYDRNTPADDHSNDEDDARNPAHRNKKIAQAGLAGAAVAGLVEHVRNKSRDPRERRDRSKSRIREGLPIAAAGLGSAAIAGLYERNKGNRMEKEARKEEERAARRRARSSRSLTRSRSRSQQYRGDDRYEGYGPGPGAGGGDPGLLEYGGAGPGGGAPLYGNPAIPEYYGGSRAMGPNGGDPVNHQMNDGPMVPAMTAAAAAGAGAVYGAQRERERDRSFSSGGSGDDRRRRRRHHRRRRGKGENRDDRDGGSGQSRSRSRGDNDARGATNGGGAYGSGENANPNGLSDHELRRQQRKEEKKERKRREAAERQAYSQDPGYAPPNDPYGNGQAYYPSAPGPGQSYGPGPNYPNVPGQPGNGGGVQIHPGYTGYPPPNGDGLAGNGNGHGHPGAGSGINQAYQGYQPPEPNVYSPPPGAAPYLNSGIGPRRADENTPFSSSDRARQNASRPGLERRASSQPPARSKVRFNISPDRLSTLENAETGRSHRLPETSGSVNDNGARIDANADARSDNLQDQKPSSTNDGNNDTESHTQQQQQQQHTPNEQSQSVPAQSVTTAVKRKSSSGQLSSTDVRSPSPAQSDTTIDLPARFDKQGRPLASDGINGNAQSPFETTGNGIHGFHHTIFMTTGNFGNSGTPSGLGPRFASRSSTGGGLGRLLRGIRFGRDVAMSAASVAAAATASTANASPSDVNIDAVPDPDSAPRPRRRRSHRY